MGNHGLHSGGEIEQEREGVACNLFAETVMRMHADLV